MKIERKTLVESIVAESGMESESRLAGMPARRGCWNSESRTSRRRAVWRLRVACAAALLLGLAGPCVAQALPARSDTPAGQPAARAATPAPQATPQSPAYTLPPEKLRKAIQLDRIRNTLDISAPVAMLALFWLLLALRGAAWLECRAMHLSRFRWVQGLIFFAALLVLDTLAGLPFDLVGHHYSLAFGIGVEGWGRWFLDVGKALGLTILFGAPVMLLFNWVVGRWPRRYWLGIWMLTVPLIALSVFVSPLLEPVFNKFEPLQKEHAGLVAALETVVARTGTAIPPERMFLMKASEKTNGLNAYVSGMGVTKRIVVWDTTAGRIPNDEVLFIFGHESGHYVLHHLPKQLAIASVFIFFLYWACARWAEWMARRFGAQWLRREDAGSPNPLAARSGFAILLFVVAVANFITTPLSNAVSRHFEHEADVYGQEAIHGLVPDPRATTVQAFDALGEAWLEDPDPSRFIEFWLYDHPSTRNRANFAAQYDPWANGGRGKFFAR